MSTASLIYKKRENSTVLDTKKFGAELKKYGFDFYSGVPCSFLKYLINYAINDCDFVMAASEGDAVAICAGAHLGGKKSVLLCQNSGLANALSPLTSLNPIFKMPLLGFVSLRGEPGLGDQPQHEMMGQITTDLLELIGIKWEYLSPDPDQALNQIERANKYIENNQSFFFVVKKHTFAPEELKKQEIASDLPKRLNALEVINKCRDDDTIVLATTGATGRELYEIQDAPNNLYMVGSMGCVSSISLGLSLAQQNKPVIAIDGDGALLMRLGTLPTVAWHTQENMLHILLDNNAHDSTGGQATVARNVDFVAIATASGYPHALLAHNLEEFEKYINDWKQHKKLTFLALKIAKGKKKGLGRPTITPSEVKERLIKFISG